MLRHLLIVTGLLCTTGAIAQKPANPATKTTEKQAPEIDYKVPGTEMPLLKVLLFQDTAARKNNGTDSSEPVRKKNKEEQKVYLTNEDVDNGSNLFVMMFNPTCSHCEDMAALMRNNVSLFKKTKLVLVANPGMRQYLPDFVYRQHLEEYPTFNIGIDSSGFIDKVYLFQMLPQINIYDHDRKLLKIYNGEIPIDSLKKYIE
jgi:hypothetical protein